MTYVFAIVLTAFSYLLIPILISLFIRIKVSKRTVLIIVILNGILIYAFHRYLVYTHDFDVPPNTAPAFIWSVVGQFILKRNIEQRSEALDTSSYDNKENSNERKSNLKFIIIATLLTVFLFFIAFASTDEKFFSRLFEKSQNTSDSHPLAGIWTYKIDDVNYSSWQFTNDGRYMFYNSKDVIKGNYKYIKATNEIILIDNTGKQNIISAIIDDNLLRIQIHDSNPIYYTLE